MKKIKLQRTGKVGRTGKMPGGRRFGGVYYGFWFFSRNKRDAENAKKEPNTRVRIVKVTGGYYVYSRTIDMAALRKSMMSD